jgi:hypothetical protein
VHIAQFRPRVRRQVGLGKDNDGGHARTEVMRVVTDVGQFHPLDRALESLQQAVRIVDAVRVYTLKLDNPMLDVRSGLCARRVAELMLNVFGMKGFCLDWKAGLVFQLIFTRLLNSPRISLGWVDQNAAG